MARGQNLLCVAVLLAVGASCVTADLLPTYREEGDQELHESGRQVISVSRQRSSFALPFTQV